MRIPKLTKTLLCIVFALLWADTNICVAQQQPSGNILNKKTTTATPSNEKKLVNILRELNRVKGVYFMFSDAALGDIMVQQPGDFLASTEQILEAILKNTGLAYKKINEQTFVILAAQAKSSANLSSLPGLQTIAGESVSTSIIAGKVTDKDNKPLAGVSVLVKGQQKGVSTNSAGVFAIEAPKSAVLVFSFVGFVTVEMVAAGSTSIRLSEKNNKLNEVVVTALGFQRKTKSLSYSAQKLYSADVATVKDANMINSLAGKTAGITISRSVSGVGGSSRVILRGNKSTRENQPLYVIDGIPVANFSPAQPVDIWGQSSGAGSGGRDGGDGISNINPDDIETITVLKGASAAALYGSQAANGVILISTKKGKWGQSRIEYSSSYTFETVLLKPALQYRYAQTIGPVANSTGSAESWGRNNKAPDHTRDFFNSGGTWTNSLAFSGGNQTAQTYISYSNTANKGILPSSRFNRHTLNMRETMKLLDDKLTIDGNFSFTSQRTNNRAVSGMYNNPLTGLYLFPRGLNFDAYARDYQYHSALRNMPLQSWWNINHDKGWAGDDNQQNPYWALYRNIRTDSRNRGMGAVTLKYQFTNWFALQARGSVDKSFDNYELKSYAGTQRVLAASNGRYTLEKNTHTQLYGDVIATALAKPFKHVGIIANAGASILDLKGNERVFFDTDPTTDPGLEYANKFSVANIRPASLFSSASMDRKQVQSVFAGTQIGYKDKIFVDFTARNDWSSTLAFTPGVNKGFFYYSAGFAVVLSELAPLPALISFGRLRLSFAKVGNDIAPYATHPPYKFIQTSNGQVKPVLNTKTPYPGTYLQPEDNRSFEVGTEWRFFKDRLSIDFTFYKNNNHRQYMEIPAPLGSGFSSYYLNMGNIQNSGVELLLTVIPIASKKVKWTSTFNFSANKNKVVKLSDVNIPGAGSGNSFILTEFGVNMFASKLKEGGSWGDIFTNKQVVKNAYGEIELDANGKPYTSNAVGDILLGNPQAKCNVGWYNTVDAGRFTLSLLVDSRFGGRVMSVTQAVLDKYGVSEASAHARDMGGIPANAVNAQGEKVITIAAQQYYSALGGRDGAGEIYMYDATSIRLREASLQYALPAFNKLIKEIRVGLVGRNLFFIKNKAPFDPETTMSTGNGLQGVDVFGLPATRSMGISLRCIF
jgi:TonB-linked SusC/RagA family outer membrane protein